MQNAVDHKYGTRNSLARVYWSRNSNRDPAMNRSGRIVLSSFNFLREMNVYAFRSDGTLTNTFIHIYLGIRPQRPELLHVLAVGCALVEFCDYHN